MLTDDIKSARLIKVKGILFLVLGLLASGALLVENPSLRSLALLGVAVWAFCRFYYFAFYVLEKYADPAHRYAGLVAMFRYLMSRRKG